MAAGKRQTSWLFMYVFAGEETMHGLRDLNNTIIGLEQKQ